MAAGSYLVSETLLINRNVTIVAEEDAMVVLDGQNARRVMTISTGVVQLTGLDITRGLALNVRCPILPFLLVPVEPGPRTFLFVSCFRRPSSGSGAVWPEQI